MIKDAWVLKCSKKCFHVCGDKKGERPRTRELDLPSCFYYTEPISTHSLGST